MKLFLLFAGLCSVVSAGHILQKQLQKYQKFADMKAMESCYGQEVFKKYLTTYLKACAKCGNMDPQQLQFISSPGKLINSLISGAEDVAHNGGDMSHGGSNNHVINIQGDFYNQGAIGSVADPVLKQLFDKIHSHPHSHDGGETFHSHPHAPGHHDNKIAQLQHAHPHSHDGGETFHSHPHATGHHDDDDDEEGHAEPHSHSRKKRQDDDGKPDEPSVNDLMAESLKQKIMSNVDKLNNKINNFTCVFQELGYTDQNDELNLKGIMEGYEKFESAMDPWIFEKCKETSMLCFDEAMALPQSVLDECPFGPKIAQLKQFAICHELRTMKTCMNYDTRKKVQELFGSVEKITEESGLEEEKLLILVQKLMYGKHH